MLLSQIIFSHETIDRQPIPEIEISALCFDSRKAEPGSLFFALTGTKTDGSQYIAEALKRGASAIVCASRSEAKGLSVPVVVVDDPRESLALAAARFYQMPTRDFYLCGVTGTCGKTTITYLLEKIWGEKTSGVIGTVNNRIAGTVQPTSLTTPDPITLQKLFAQMKSAGVTKAVAEVSSHALQQKRIHGSQFDSVVFTNLSQDHLDYHKDMQDYFEAKKILFNNLIQNSTKKNRLIVVNADDASGQQLVQALRNTQIPTQTFSLSNPQATVHVATVRYTPQGTEALFKLNGEQITIKTNLLGAHNLQNIMTVLLVAQHAGTSLKHIADALQHVVVPGRLERVGQSGFFVDYAHKPSAMTNVLTTMRNVMQSGPSTLPRWIRQAHHGQAQGRSGQASASPRLGIVFGCGGDRDTLKRPIMGEIAAELADFVIVTSDNPRTEDPQSIIAQILPGVQKMMQPFDGQKGFLVEVDRRAALKKAVEIAHPDDIVIVAGKGHEDYQIIGTEKHHFDDVEEVSKCLSV